MNRKSETLRIRKAATYYLTDKNYSIYDEVGLKSSSKSSKLRADLLGVTMAGQIILIEVKSCWQDFTSDTKWEQYLKFCNKMYFAIADSLYESKHGEYIKKRLKEFGVGLLVVFADGTIKVMSNAKHKKLEGKTRRWIITKLAWRGGFCKATSDRSMRFSTKAVTDTVNLLEFLTMSKVDRSSYISKYPNCGYKKYVNYPNLSPDYILGNTEP